MKHKQYSSYEKYIKRPLDCCLATCALIVLSPLLLVIAILIKKDMGSPILFKQHRIGKDDKEFSMYKFRSMTDARDDNGVFLPDDQRITKLGNFIRKTSIDELPSLINILKGDMAVIGPRPLPTRYLKRYNDQQRRRHEVRPGLSNPSTTHGRNRQTWEQQFEGDVWYVDHVGFLVDVKSIIDTIKIVLSHKGATASDGGSRGEFIGTANIEQLMTDPEGNYMKIQNCRRGMQMKKLFIIGAGGFGRELLQWVKDINTVKPTWDIQGFIDDDLNALDGLECDYPVVGSLSDCHPKEDEYYVLAIANPRTKEKIVSDMERRNMHFASIIHPTAILTRYSHYGEGLIMFPCAKLSVNSTVGKHVTIMSSGVGHDVKVGDYCTLCGNVTVIRNVVIGDRTYIASNVALNADIHIGNDCYIGMGSMVMNDIPDNSKTFCNPARILPQ